jgi:hypothetical protein
MSKERRIDLSVSITCTDKFYEEELKSVIEKIRSGETEREMMMDAEGGITRIKVHLVEGGGTKEERLKRFAESLEPFKGTYGRDLLNEFYKYWTEISPTGRKHRWECEKFFDISKRLAKFHKNNVTNFGKVIPKEDAKKLNEGRSWN